MIKSKIFLAFVVILFLNNLKAQLVDDFVDGDFTLNPPWNGDNGNFEVDGNGRLHLNAPAVADTSFLSTPSESFLNASWTFFVEMDFDPSSSNYAKVYLSSSENNLASTLEGYFVKLGNTSDDISLYRQDGLVETLLINGTDGLLGLSNGNDATVKVTRDNLGNWELFADTSAGVNYVSQGTVFDNTYFSSNYFGVFAKYTSTRSDLFFFDNFLVTGEVFVDNLPPTVTQVFTVSNTQLDVLFSENLDLLTAGISNNYFVNNSIGNPTNVAIDGLNEALLHLTFGQVFFNGIENQITVSGISDLSGNVMISQTLPFAYFEVTNATYKNVVFNEIFADPTPSVGMSDAEFLEIYNASNNFFDLLDWKLINTTTEKILPSYGISPNEYLIVCDVADTNLFSGYGNVLPISSFSTLSNDGDSLTLLNQLGDIIDIVYYEIDWYQNTTIAEGGWTLELINPETECSNATNWIASTADIGGTPGSINSAYNNTPDTIRPIIENYFVLNATTLQLNFNELMDATSLIGEIYTVNNFNSVSSISVVNNNQSAVLTFINPLDTGIQYTVSISGATDCEGNAFASPTNIDFIIGFQPKYGDLLVNEIMADPTPEVGLPDAEYLELVNTSDKAIDLSNSSIDNFMFPSGSIILPNGFMLLLDDTYFTLFPFTTNKLSMPWGSSYLTNDGKEIVLKNASSIELDRVNYSIDWYLDTDKNDGGWSLERINPEAPCLASQNWNASISASGGTPGFQNSIYNLSADVAAPILLSVLVIDENTIELVFNEKLDTNSTFLADYVITENILISSLKNIGSNNTNVLAELSNPMLKGIVYYIEVTGIADCSGNIVTEASSIPFGLPEKPSKGDVIINEALFYPRTGGVDFVEIYNNSNKLISLKNWKLANIENENIANEQTISMLPILLLPNDFCVLTSNKTNILSEYPNSIGSKFIEMESLPTYNNDEGSIVLVSSFADGGDSLILEESDRFDYSENLHFPLINNLQGISLERIDYNRPTNDATNWLSAASSVGYATPGFINSQFHQTIEGESEISIEPEIFSPDNDGVGDVVNINYKFDQVGFTGNIIIFDSKGRLIKNLIQNELLTQKGTVSWNGINNENEKARVGIYLVYAEIFSVNGIVKSFKKPFVLAGK